MPRDGDANRNNTPGSNIFSRPLIGLTLMLDEPEQDTHRPRYSMNRTFFESIRAAGGVPVPLVPGDPEEMKLYARTNGDPDDKQASLALDGICLSAGGDIDPRYFDQPLSPACGEIDRDRDEMEMALLALIRDTEIPVFAICRGLQVLNIAWGGDIFQDIAESCPEAQRHDFFHPHPRDYSAHEITIAPDSRLAKIMGESKMMVNSLHHQAIDRVGEGLKVSARADDGIIEGIENIEGDRFLIGVQFHPEDLPESRPMQRLFEAHVAAARQYRAR